jgi:hypothetical protein
MVTLWLGWVKHHCNSFNALLLQLQQQAPAVAAAGGGGTEARNLMSHTAFRQSLACVSLLFQETPQLL